MPKGGKRDGAGRKSGSHNKSTKEIRDIVQKNVDFSVLAKKMFELVEGVTVEGENKDGEAYQVDKEPNVAAARLLLEYGFGKPREIVEIDLGANTEKIAVIFAKMVSASGAGAATP